MKRWAIAGLALLLGLSLAVNGVVGWIAWRSSREYMALSRQFVKVKQDLKLSEERAKKLEAAQAKPGPAAPPQTATAAAPGPTEQAEAASASGSGSTSAIRAAYEPRFEGLQSECEGQLNSLLVEAKAEYQAAKTAGKSVDVAALGARYYARADGLRRDCDRKVEGLLSQMAGDLRAAGLSLDLVDEVRSAYEERIVERQAEIMAKAH